MGMSDFEKTSVKTEPLLANHHFTNLTTVQNFNPPPTVSKLFLVDYYLKMI